MASTSTLRSVGGFVAAAATALVVFAIVSDPFGGTPTASIALTVSAAESQDTLLVTAEYRGFASLDVAPAVDDVRTPVRDVLAYDSSGAEVPVQVLSGAAQSGFEGASVPRRSYRLASGAAPGNVYEVRYAVSSATGRFGGNCRSPLRFSTISGGATVVPLSSMLLVPSRPFDRLSVAVPDDSALVLLPDGSKSFAADGDPRASGVRSLSTRLA